MPVATVRDRKAGLTRDAILDALVGLISEEGVHDFSVQRVADGAGVAHRTVYRYFPTREALLEGLGERLSRQFAQAIGWKGDSYPDAPPEMIGRLIERGYRIYESQAKELTAYVILSIGARLKLPSRARRTAWLEKLTRNAAPHLQEEDMVAAAAVVRLLSSSASWYFARSETAADAVALARAVRWAIDTLIADLQAGGGPKRASAEEGSWNHS